MKQSKSETKKPSNASIRKSATSCQSDCQRLRVWTRTGTVEKRSFSNISTVITSTSLGLVPTMKEKGSVLISEALVRKIVTQWLRTNSPKGKSLNLISMPRSQKIKDRSTSSQRRWFLEATRRDQKTISKRVREYMLWESSGIPALDALDEQDCF